MLCIRIDEVASYVSLNVSTMLNWMLQITISFQKQNLQCKNLTLCIRPNFEPTS
jgi:hypothetical protein